MFQPAGNSYGHYDRGSCFGLALALILVSAWSPPAFFVGASTLFPREVGSEVESCFLSNFEEPELHRHFVLGNGTR